MYKYKLKEVEVGDVDVRGGVKSTVTDIDPETGGITWSITDVAAFDTVYKTFNKLKKFLKKLEATGEAEKDPVLDEISDKVEDLFSDYWTHIRSTYPEAYDKIKLTKESVNEAKETFYFDDILDILNGSSFSQEIKPTDPKIKELLQKKYKNIVDFARTVASTYDIKPSSTLNPTPDTPPKSFTVPKTFKYTSSKMSSPIELGDQVIAGEYKLLKSRRGKHTYLNPNNVKIRLSDSDLYTFIRPENNLTIVNEAATDRFLQSAARNLAKQMRGKSASRDTLMNRLNSMPLASRLKSDELNKIIDYTMQEMGLIDEGEGEGYLTPKAFDKNKKSTGANDIYYYKLGYKPVPKKIKGSGLEVKQLFEKEELTEYSDFQQKRLQQFSDIEEKLNQISPLLSNAKNETAKYYNENPGSYEVVYSTDMIGSLVDDITELLKQEE